jgi:hypothetical protein
MRIENVVQGRNKLLAWSDLEELPLSVQLPYTYAGSRPLRATVTAVVDHTDLVRADGWPDPPVPWSLNPPSPK